MHASARLYIAESTLVDDEGRQLARGSGTFMKTTIALDASLGYGSFRLFTNRRRRSPTDGAPLLPAGRADVIAGSS